MQVAADDPRPDPDFQTQETWRIGQPAPEKRDFIVQSVQEEPGIIGRLVDGVEMLRSEVTRIIRNSDLVSAFQLEGEGWNRGFGCHGSAVDSERTWRF